MFSRFFKAIIPALALCIIATGCDDKKRTDVSSTTIVCDNSFENIMEQEIDIFEYAYPKNFVLCRYVTQAEAVDSLFSGNTRTAVIGRDLTKDERISLRKKYPNLRSTKIAVDAVALIVNEENGVDFLSMKELREIFTGETKKWSDIAPEGANHNINIVFDSEGSGLATFMRDSVLHGKAFGPNVRSVGSVQNVFDAVTKQKNTLGVIGVSWLTRDLEVDTISVEKRMAELQDDKAVIGQDINDRMDASGVKVLGIMRDDALRYKPYQQYIYDGSYPLTRPIYMITTGSPAGAVGRFYTFVTSTEGQRLIMKTGILPARVQVNVYEVSR